MRVTSCVKVSEILKIGWNSRSWKAGGIEKGTENGVATCLPKVRTRDGALQVYRTAYKRLERFVGGLFSLATKKEGQEKLPNPPHLTALL
jgi:hypothetical protein